VEPNHKSKGHKGRPAGHTLSWFRLRLDHTSFSFSLFFSSSVSSRDFKNFFSNGFNILAVDPYSRVELCMPIWLNHDYEVEGVVDILVVDAYSGMDECTPKFMGEASN
jgi:hypothetical protein